MKRIDFYINNHLTNHREFVIINYWISLETGYIQTQMPMEIFKRLLMHPYVKLPFTWCDEPQYLFDQNNSLIRIGTTWFCQILEQYPDELQRIFKQCFYGIFPAVVPGNDEDFKLASYFMQPTYDK